MSNAVAGPGWLLKHNGTTITEVLDIKGPTQTADKDEVTNQSSPDNTKEWITTLIDGGDCTFKCNYVPGDSTQAGLLTALIARGVEPFVIEPPSPNAAHTLVFNARVGKWEPEFPTGKKATLDIVLFVTGPVVVN